jgi:hypothetical protein
MGVVVFFLAEWATKPDCHRHARCAVLMPTPEVAGTTLGDAGQRTSSLAGCSHAPGAAAGGAHCLSALFFTALGVLALVIPAG